MRQFDFAGLFLCLGCRLVSSHARFESSALVLLNAETATLRSTLGAEEEEVVRFKGRAWLSAGPALAGKSLTYAGSEDNRDNLHEKLVKKSGKAICVR